MLRNLLLILAASSLTVAACAGLTQNAATGAGGGLGIPSLPDANALTQHIQALAQSAQSKVNDCAAVATDLEGYLGTEGGEMTELAKKFNTAEDQKAAQGLVAGQTPERTAAADTLQGVVFEKCAGNLEVAKSEWKLREILGAGSANPAEATAAADVHAVYQKRIDGFCVQLQSRVGEAMGSPNLPDCKATEGVMLEMVPTAQSMNLKALPPEEIRACDATFETLYHSGCQSFPGVNEAIVALVGSR